MQDNELINLWKSYDQKMEETLSLNKRILYELTKGKLDKTLLTMRRPKITMVLIGIVYTLLLYLLTFIAYMAGGVFVMLGFGAIALLMTALIIFYCYQLHLIHQISNSDEIIFVQERLSRLRLSSFNCVRLAVLQLPFWSVCWISLDALKHSPFLYGSVNVLVFVGLTYLAYWLYSNISLQQPHSKISRFFLSGSGWEPIIKSRNLLEQLKAYKD